MRFDDYNIGKRLIILEEDFKNHIAYYWLVIASTVINLWITFYLLFGNSKKLETFDYISASLTTLQIFIAVVIITGFWMIREAAKRAAEKAAIDHINRELINIIEKEVRITLPKYLETYNVSGDSQDMQSMIDTLD